MKVSNNCSSCEDVSEERLKIKKFTEINNNFVDMIANSKTEKSIIDGILQSPSSILFLDSFNLKYSNPDFNDEKLYKKVSDFLQFDSTFGTYDYYTFDFHAKISNCNLDHDKEGSSSVVRIYQYMGFVVIEVTKKDFPKTFKSLELYRKLKL